MVGRVEDDVPSIHEALHASRRSEDPNAAYMPLLVCSFVTMIPGVAQAVIEWCESKEWDEGQEGETPLQGVDVKAAAAASAMLCDVLMDLAEGRLNTFTVKRPEGF